MKIKIVKLFYRNRFDVTILRNNYLIGKFIQTFPPYDIYPLYGKQYKERLISGWSTCI